MTTPARVIVGFVLSSFALLVFVAAAGGGSWSTTVAGPTVPRVGPTVYRDAAGDAKGGPDLESVTVSDTGGMIRLVVDVVWKAPQSAALTPFVDTFLDTNGDNTAEYMFDVDRSKTGTNWCLVNFAAKSKCMHSPTVSSSASGSTYTLRVASADLAGATGFDIWAKAGTFTNTGKVKTTITDSSPANWSSYTLGSVKLILGTPVVNPATPVAGQLFTITVPVSRSDGVQLPGGKGTRITAGMPTLDGEAVIPDDLDMQFKNGISVSFTVPADAAGKVLTLPVSAMSGQMGSGVLGVSTYNLSASRNFSFTVAPAL